MSAEDVKVRTARTVDRPALVGFMAALQDHERNLSRDRGPGAEMADAHLAYLESLAAADGRILVATRGGAPVGFLVCVIEESDAGDLHLLPAQRRHGVVTDLFVVPAERRRGVARALLAAAEAHCRMTGLRTLRIAALAANAEALRSYRGAGFEDYEITLSKRL